MKVDLTGKIALVTGASSGLGWHFAHTLARSGATVMACARRTERLQALTAALHAEGLKAHAATLDVTDPASVDQCVADTAALLGGIDIVVNNAGIALVKAALEWTHDDWQSVIDTNLTGAWRVAQAAARHMAGANRSGSIINIASILGLRVATQGPAYVAAKAGLIHLTQALALEWARHRIRVNAIAPGYILTDMNRDYFASEMGQAAIKRIPQRRIGRPEDLDGALLLLASDASDFMTGSTITVDGGHAVNSL
jgi:NAD(P)-dependent dehydrogenase (short-subunit alcohol dehydrogenase family)